MATVMPEIYALNGFMAIGGVGQDVAVAVGVGDGVRVGRGVRVGVGTFVGGMVEEG